VVLEREAYAVGAEGPVEGVAGGFEVRQEGYGGREGGEFGGGDGGKAGVVEGTRGEVILADVGVEDL